MQSGDRGGTGRGPWSAAAGAAEANLPGTALRGAALGAVWVASLLLYLLLPPSPDNFDHSYVAWRTLNGARPYEDLIDINWPGTLALHALSLALFGVHEWSWRALDFALAGVSLWCLADLMREAAGARAGRAVLWIGPLLYVTAGYWVAGQKDMSAAQLALVALWCHVRTCSTLQLRYQVGAGLALAVAVLNKPHIGLLALLLPLQALRYRPSWGWFGRYSLTGAAALLFGLLAAVLVLGQLGTTWQGFWESGFVYALQRPAYATDTITQLLSAVGRPGTFRFWHLLVLMPLPVAWVLYRRRGDPLALTGLLLLWLSGIISALAQRKGFAYQSSAAILTGIGMFSAAVALCFEAAARGGSGSPHWRRWILCGCGVALLAMLPWRLHVSYGRLPQALGGRGLDWHAANFSGEAGRYLTMADVHAVVRRLRDEGGGGCLYFVGESSAINLLTGRPQPTRFFYLPMLKLAEPPLPMAQRWNELYAADLSAAQCEEVFVSRARNREWLEGPRPAARALRRFLEKYRLRERIGVDGGIEVYVRRGP